MRFPFPRQAAAMFAVIGMVMTAACGSLNTDPGATSAPPRFRLSADNHQLWQAAAKVLQAEGIGVERGGDLPTLRLQESVRRKKDSLAADGSVGVYKLTYTLRYQLPSEAMKTIEQSDVVSNDENRYQASQKRREQLVENFRKEALIQMIYQEDL